MKQDPLIKLSNVAVSYEDKVILRDINLALYPQGRYGLIGPSGCGKTTLLYALSNLLKKSARLQGSLWRRADFSTAIVLQAYGLFPWKTVRQNMSLPWTLHGKEDLPHRKLDDYLQQLGLTDYQDYYPKALSGGQQQRVAIGRALLSNADLLLLDEPFSSLDALTRERLQEEVSTLLNQETAALLLVTHNIEEVVYMTKHIFVMDHQGSLMREISNPSYGLRDPRNTRAYLETCTLLRQTLKEIHDEKAPLDL